MDEFFRRTTVTGRSYDVFKCIKILNPLQAAFYVSSGVPLRDIKLSKDVKNGKDIFVFYFYKDDTKDAYDEWCRNGKQDLK